MNNFTFCHISRSKKYGDIVFLQDENHAGESTVSIKIRPDSLGAGLGVCGMEWVFQDHAAADEFFKLICDSEERCENLAGALYEGIKEQLGE